MRDSDVRRLMFELRRPTSDGMSWLCSLSREMSSYDGRLACAAILRLAQRYEDQRSYDRYDVFLPMFIPSDEIYPTFSENEVVGLGGRVHYPFWFRDSVLVGVMGPRGFQDQMNEILNRKRMKNAPSGWMEVRMMANAIIPSLESIGDLSDADADTLRRGLRLEFGDEQ